MRAMRFAVALLAALGTVGVGASVAQADATYSCGSPGSSGTIQSGSTATLTGGSCTLSGTIPAGATVDVSDGTGVAVSSGSANDGTIDFTDGNEAFDTSAGGTFTNAGTIEDTSTTNSQQMYAGTFLNTGTITDDGAIFYFDGETSDGSSSTGVLENASGGKLIATAGAEFQLNGNGTYGTSLELERGSTTTIANSGPIDSSQSGRIIIDTSNLEVGGGTMTGEMEIFQSNVAFDSTATAATGTLNWASNGNLTGTIPAGYTIGVDGAGITATSGTVNDGTIDFIDDNDNVGTNAGGTFTNAGTIEDTATGNGQQLTAGTLTNTGTIESSGAGGNLAFVGDSADGDNDGTLDSSGTISMPAGVTFGITGNLALGSSSVLSLGVASASSYGQLNVTGKARLAGTLSVKRASSYTPANGDMESIVSAGSLSGTFAHTLGGNGAGFYTVRYGSTGATLVTGASSSASTGHVGSPTVAGTAVQVPLSCSTGTGPCTLEVALSVVEKVRYGKHTVGKTVTVSKTVKIAAGASTTAKLALNGTDKRLLAKHHSLTAKLSVKQAGKTIASRSVKFKVSKA